LREREIVHAELAKFAKADITILHFSMIELSDFYNDGFGWVCRQCERELGGSSSDAHSRLLREGEAESKQPQLSSTALAKWADPAQRILVCPRCGISESIDKS
jgi:rubrerythrin